MTKRRKMSFVRALLQGKTAELNKNDVFDLHGGKRKASLPKEDVLDLASDGVVCVWDNKCAASDSALNWVKRQMLHTDQFSAQHRDIKIEKDKVPQNLREGAMAQLSIARNGAPAFMQRYHVEAASRVQVLVERGQLRQRTTMSYDPTRSNTKSSGVGAMADLGDSAIDARKALNNCMRDLPNDCASIVMDVCGLQKGLQLVETERRWPRRSAKLILRVGLEQVAAHFGLMPVATGKTRSKPQYWMEADARASDF